MQDCLRHVHRVFWRTIKRIVLWATAATGISVMVLAVLVFHKAAGPAVQTSPIAAAEFEAKLQQHGVHAEHGLARTFTADEKELNSFIESRLQLARNLGTESNSSFRDMKLQLKQDRMRIYVLFNGYGKDMTVDFEGKLHTENGYVLFEPISGKIGALPIPRSALQSSMRRMMNSPQSREALRLPENLSDIHVEGGRIVASFR
jgi:uncharacterized protein YpmS